MAARSSPLRSTSSRATCCGAAWAALVDEYLRYVERLFSPDLFILGGGVSERADRFVPLLTVRAEVVPAAMGNDAGTAGATWFACNGAAAP